MGFSETRIRSLNIFDNNLVKQLNIDNIQEQLNEPFQEDMDDYPCIMINELIELYTFCMNWIDYEEYISEKIYSNWNSLTNIISFKPIWTDSITIETYIWQGWECPSCKEWHFETSDELNCKCLECGYEWKIEEFEVVFN